MEIAAFAIGIVLGLVVGIGVMLVVDRLRKKEAGELARELVEQSQTEKVEDLNRIIDQLRDSFGRLSQDALKEFQAFADRQLRTETEASKQDLQQKKDLITQNIQGMAEKLGKLQDLVGKLDKERESQAKEFSTNLDNAMKAVEKLDQTSQHLANALSGTHARGQWGERMAEDILRLAGFIEGVNYVKQKAMDGSSTKPDYTFFLPDGFKINMDVKFPLDNFRRFLDAETDSDREQYRSLFLKDVRDRIKEATSRDYINPAEQTVDYVLVFIPNEQVYGFIHESDSSILDMALEQKAVLCSPLTLYAVLAVIRQAAENFNLGRTAGEIMSLLASFEKQWRRFVESMEKMGRKLDDAQKEYINLTTTRTNQLERELRKIDELRQREQMGVNGDGPPALGPGEDRDEKASTDDSQ
ncbi:MAG: DNA recombination protein RmuC [Planctomycetes bacterium]|nr:DNA recombination protein RmuC [Planctomycetota bacterium]